MMIIALLALLGMLLSGYMLFVEKKLEKNSSYKAACDISDKISCTRAAKSASSKTYGISNALLGLIYYGGMFVLALLQSKDLVMLLSAVGFGATYYFAYELYVKVQSFCLVCTSTYVINILIFVIALRDYFL